MSASQGLQLGPTGRLQLSCTVALDDADIASAHLSVRFGIKGPANGSEWSLSVRGVRYAAVVPSYLAEVPINPASTTLLEAQGGSSMKQRQRDNESETTRTPSASFSLDVKRQELSLAFDCIGDVLLCGGEAASTMTFVSVVSSVIS